ncbi:hypothetical protein CTI14_65645, partial [Methylobacterium radiotolerans]
YSRRAEPPPGGDPRRRCADRPGPRRLPDPVARAALRGGPRAGRERRAGLLPGRRLLTARRTSTRWRSASTVRGSTWAASASGPCRSR